MLYLYFQIVYLFCILNINLFFIVDWNLLNSLLYLHKNFEFDLLHMHVLKVLMGLLSLLGYLNLLDLLGYWNLSDLHLDVLGYLYLLDLHLDLLGYLYLFFDYDLLQSHYLGYINSLSFLYYLGLLGLSWWIFIYDCVSLLLYYTALRGSGLSWRTVEVNWNLNLNWTIFKILLSGNRIHPKIFRRWILGIICDNLWRGLEILRSAYLIESYWINILWIFYYYILLLMRLRSSCLFLIVKFWIHFSQLWNLFENIFFLNFYYI